MRDRLRGAPVSGPKCATRTPTQGEEASLSLERPPRGSSPPGAPASAVPAPASPPTGSYRQR